MKRCEAMNGSGGHEGGDLDLYKVLGVGRSATTIEACLEVGPTKLATCVELPLVAQIVCDADKTVLQEPADYSAPRQGRQ